MSSNNVIVVKNYGDTIRKEAVGSGTIKPGHLLERTNAGLFQVHTDASGPAQLLVADYNDLEGKTIDDNYLTGARIFAWIPRRGDEVNALIANGETIAIGDKLVSNGDGTLKKFTADATSVTEIDEYVLFEALEACAMAGSSAVDDPRCLVEAL